MMGLEHISNRRGAKKQKMCIGLVHFWPISICWLIGNVVYFSFVLQSQEKSNDPN